MAASIEDIPPEVVLLIFKILRIDDVENCFKICKKWRGIAANFIIKPHLKCLLKLNEDVQNIFQEEGWTEECNNTDEILDLYEKVKSYKDRILVITGPPGRDAQEMAIIDLVNPDNKIELPSDIPIPCECGLVGGLLQGKGIICGGGKYINTYHSQDCFVIGQPSKDILQHRDFASSVVLNKTTLWVVGGWNGISDLRSTELVTLDQASTIGPELPFSIRSQGMVNYNNNAIYIIGGIQRKKLSRDTWIVDPSNEFKIRKGPSLNKRRSRFSCGKMISNGKTILVVAGGQYLSYYLDTVEILDPFSDKGWVLGIKSNK